VTATTQALDDDQLRTLRYARLGVESHASLVTLDSLGRPLPEIVWIAPYAGRLLLWVPAGSGLTRRITAEHEAQVAPCNEHGRLLDDPAPVAARVVFPQEYPTVIAAMTSKYGWRFRVARLLGLVGRALLIRPRGHVGIELTLL
jgi:PPOX class probable F420-dependent enzyme